MDLNTQQTSQSPNLMAIMEAIKNDPNFFTELKADPKQALSKIGLELNEQEMGLIQKLGNIGELEAEAEGFFDKIKGLFGLGKPNA